MGKLGKVRPQSKRVRGTGGKSHITTPPLLPPGAHAVHQITGTIVSLLSLVVVSQVFVVTPGGCMISVDTSGGTVVIVEVTTLVLEISPEAVMLVLDPLGIVV